MSYLTNDDHICQMQPRQKIDVVIVKRCLDGIESTESASYRNVEHLRQNHAEQDYAVCVVVKLCISSCMKIANQLIFGVPN